MEKNENYLINLSISRETIERLKKFEELILKWNQKINLVSSNSDQLWQRHIIDSIQLLEFIESKNIDLLDVGSGAGFPGVVLSIAGVKKVTLVESDSKKAAFLLQAASLSSNKIFIINDRIENVSLQCDILTSRAWANINNIFKFSKKIIVRDKYLLLKGKNYVSELEKAKNEWEFEYNIENSITSLESKIIEIRNLTQS